MDYYSIAYNIKDNPQVLVERITANSVDLVGLTANVIYEVAVSAVAGIGGDRVESSSVLDTFILSTAHEISISSTKINKIPKSLKRVCASWIKGSWGGWGQNI